MRERGVEVFDMGVDDPDVSADYPDYAAKVARAVAGGEAEFGVVVCKSGLGSCIAANKIDGIRASHPGTLDEAFLTRSHNNANVLCLGQDTVDTHFNLQLLDKFLHTPFSGEERHQRRIDKITQLEQER